MSASAECPNILLVLTDQHRWDFMGYMGHPALQGLTPHFDRLAREGTAFTHCYSPNPLCMPARNAIHTGLYTFQSGQMNNIGDWPMDLPTFTQALQALGYHTALTGKIHAHEGVGYDLDLAEPRWREEIRALGFDDVLQVAGKTMAFFVDDDYTHYLAERGLLYAYREDIVERVEAHAHGEADWWPSILPEEAFVDAFIGRHAAEWFRHYDDEGPWFHMLSFCSPHPSYDAPASALERVDRDLVPLPQHHERPDDLCDMVANYIAQIHIVDENLGLVLAALEERGWLDDTLILFTADHGEMGGGPDASDTGKSGKCHWEDGSTRVPLLVRPPTRMAATIVPPGSRIEASVSCHDVTATILDAAGGEGHATQALPGCSSHSLWPLLAGAMERTRQAVYSENGGQFASPWRMMDDGSWKYVWLVETAQELLFHKAEDPFCLTDVAVDHPDVVARLRRAMLREHLEHPAPKTGRAAYSPLVPHRIGRERLQRYNREQ
jgi:arylsulfatase